jgi:hypothetical protein
VTSSIYDVNTLAQFNGLQYSPAAYFFAVDGTAYPNAPYPPTPALNDGTGAWSGFASGMWGGLANAQDGLFAGGCIGYPAAMVPMGPSVTAGVVALASAVEFAANLYASQNGGSMAGFAYLLSGYSQGAMVTATYWLDYVLNPQGVHNYLAPYLWRIYQFGDPYRCPGIAYGNALAGLSQSILTDGVQSGGIGGPLDLTVAQTNTVAPDGHYVNNSCANPGDLYSAAPVGTNPWTEIAAAGEVGFRIFREVQNPTLINTLEIATALGTPIGMVEEIINGMSFFSQGTNAPHWHYFTQMDACIADALAVGQSLPYQSGF